MKLIEVTDGHHTSRPVKLRMLDVGMCGTDKEICAGRPGHADSAQVVSTGEMLSVPGRPAGLLQTGDLVEHGIKGAHGYLTDYCVSASEGGDHAQR